MAAVSQGHSKWNTLQLALSHTFEISKLGGEAGLCKWKPVEKIKIHFLHS
jgi:hypothetical protein